MGMAPRTRADNAPLEPGHTSIDRARPTPLPDGTGYRLRWRLCHLDGHVTDHRTRGRTKSEVRARAKRTAADILGASADHTWRPSSTLTDYIATVSAPLIDNPDLAENTRRRYHVALDQLTTALAGHTIATGTRFRTLETALQSIATDHGPESARQARTVWSKYVAGQLVRDELIVANPLAGARIDLSAPKHAYRPPGGQALTAPEYRRVIDHLLALDPTDVPPPRRGSRTHADRIAKRRAVIDLTLLQATTGLRVTEANTLRWDQVTDTGDTLHLTVLPETSKTRRGRTVPILDPRIADRIRDRRTPARPLVIGAPLDGTTPWDPANCRRAVAAFYPELAAVTDTPLLATARTHVWRATLNSLLLGVPLMIRAAYFGHNEAANTRYYTDTTDTGALVTAARAHLIPGPDTPPDVPSDVPLSSS